MEQFYIRLYNYKVESKKKTIIIASIITIMIIGLVILLPRVFANRKLNYYTSLIQKAYVEISLEAIKNKEEPITINRKELIAKGLRVNADNVSCNPCVINDNKGYKNYEIIVDDSNHSIALRDVKNNIEKAFYVDEEVILN